MWFLNKKEKVVSMDFSYVDTSGFRNNGSGNLYIPKDTRLVDFLRCNKKLEFRKVKLGEFIRRNFFGVDRRKLISLGLKKVPEPEYGNNLYHDIELVSGFYGKYDQSYDDVKAKIALLDKDYLKKIAREPFIVVKDFESKKHKYPAAILFRHYFHIKQIC